MQRMGSVVRTDVENALNYAMSFQIFRLFFGNIKRLLQGVIMNSPEGVEI